MRAWRLLLLTSPVAFLLTVALFGRAAENVILKIDTPMPAPKWAQLERKLLADSGPACREFYDRFIDEKGYLRCFVRWGADDGPDDAPENFNRWPELHAAGAPDEIRTMYEKGWEGHIKQYTEAKTVDVPIARDGMYYKEFCVQMDWMHNGEGTQLFNRMGLNNPNDAKYQDRARRYAGFYMDEDPEAKNYDPKLKIIRSMMNGSKGPMLRLATALDWTGDPFDVAGYALVHKEGSYKEMLAHYDEYTDVVGDHFLNLVATTQPLNAYMLKNEDKYKKWIVEYMDAWLERMKQNGGVIPSKIGLDGKIGGDDGKWWGHAYGWGFSPVNPVNGRRENRNRIPRAIIGFNSALWVTGDQKYVDAWRTMMDAINSHAKVVGKSTQYPTMYGDEGWYGWKGTPWNEGALQVWYWSQKAEDLQRVGGNGWLSYLQGNSPNYPETALQKDIDTMKAKVAQVRKYNVPSEKRLADNVLDLNPAAITALVQLTMGGIPPEANGSQLNARLRYFDLERKRAGLPGDVGALVSEMTDTGTVVTLVNLSKEKERTIIVQGGAYGEHQIDSVTIDGKTTKIDAPLFTIQLAPGAGQRISMQMKRYANAPTVMQPWDRK